MRKTRGTMGLFLVAILVMGVSACGSQPVGPVPPAASSAAASSAGTSTPVSTTASVSTTALTRSSTSTDTHSTDAHGTDAHSTDATSPDSTISSAPPVTPTDHPTPSTGPNRTTASAPTNEPDASSAAAAVAPFLAAAAQADRNIAKAATAVNASYHGTVVTFDPATVDLVAHARPSDAARAIPAGLDPTLERALLLVYSDLESRYAALHGESCVQVGTFAVDKIDPNCFVAGHAAAVRMQGDLSAAATLAATTAAPEPLPAGSPAAAQPGVRVSYIEGNNEGCGSHGGFIATGPIDVHWTTAPAAVPVGSSLEGQVNGVHFTATYAGGAAWKVHINAC